MSGPGSLVPHESDLPSHLTSWLRRLSVDDPPAESPQPTRALTRGAQDCLRHAAECYSRAAANSTYDREKWLGQACAVYEQLGDLSRAASGRERLQQWLLAARIWRRAEKWESAARCFLSGDRPEDAAECYRRAGRDAEAAWTLTRHANRHRRARLLADALSPTEAIDRLELDIVRAACDAGEGLDRAAAARLRRCTIELLASTDSRRIHLLDRVFKVAEALGRPDLMAGLHATAIARQLGSPSRWQKWAGQWETDFEPFRSQPTVAHTTHPVASNDTASPAPENSPDAP